MQSGAPVTSDGVYASVAVLQNPDGTAGFAIASAPPAPPVAPRALHADYAGEEAAALRDMQRMRAYDEVALAASRDSGDRELALMLAQDAAVSAQGVAGCPVYRPAAHADDEVVRTAVEANDAAAFQVIAALAGGDPLVATTMEPTPGMSWLERMQSEDAALRAKIDRTDSAIRPSR